MEKSFDPKGKKFLAISAHADDADFNAAGTMIKWIRAGASGAIVIATNGDKGSPDEKQTSKALAQTRRKEQMSVSKFIGLKHTWFLEYPDAQLEVTQTLKSQLVNIIRTWRPDAVFTFDPTLVYSLKRNWINHPDHRAIGQASLDAIFPMSRDFLTFQNQYKENLSPHKVSNIFLYNFDNANYFEDVTASFEDKLTAFCLHKSQFLPEKVKPMLKKLAKENASRVSGEYAESFIRIQVDSL